MMKNLLLLNLFVFVIVLASCKKDLDTTEISQKVVSSIEIGYDGGEIEYEDIAITVPDGSFNGYFTVNLLEIKKSEIFDSNEASTYYTISGLPLHFFKPLEIKLEYGGSEEVFAVIGEEALVPSTGELSQCFRFVDVVKSGSSYSFFLDPSDDDYTSDDTTQIIIGLVKDFVKVESNSNLGTNQNKNNDFLKSETVNKMAANSKFVVYAPAVYVDEAYELQKYLEEAYSLFSSSSLGFSYNKRTKWPVQATVRKLKSGTYGYFVPSKWGNNSGYMEFNEEYLKNNDELKLTVGHEFLHLVQSLYDPRFAFMKAITPSDYYWMEEASAVWAEGLFSKEKDYYSSIRNGHQLAPFKGMFDGAKENAAHHGYGMSAFVKYITDKYGDKIVAKVFEQETGGSNVYNALNQVLPDALSVIYPDFLDDYIQGNIYDDMSAANLLGNADGTFSINTVNDTLKVFEGTYPGLSAHIYKLDIKYDGFNERNRITLKTNNGTKKYIYKIKGSNLTFLGSALGEYEIPNIKEIQTEKAMIIVVVVQQYYTELKEKLEIKVNARPPVEFDEAKFEIKNLKIVDDLIRNYGTPNAISSVADEVIYTLKEPYMPGVYNDGVFISNWDYIDGGFRYFGKIEVEINEAKSKVTNIKIERNFRSLNSSSEFFRNITIELDNVDSDINLDGSYASLGFSGVEVCSKITKFYKQELHTGFHRTSRSYSCYEFTGFNITLHKKDN